MYYSMEVFYIKGLGGIVCNGGYLLNLKDSTIVITPHSPKIADKEYSQGGTTSQNYYKLIECFNTKPSSIQNCGGIQFYFKFDTN